MKKSDFLSASFILSFDCFIVLTFSLVFANSFATFFPVMHWLSTRRIVFLVGRAQVVRSRGPRIWPRLGRRWVPHVQLKSEMLRLCGAEAEGEYHAYIQIKMYASEKVHKKINNFLADLLIAKDLLCLFQDLEMRSFLSSFLEFG